MDKYIYTNLVNSGVFMIAMNLVFITKILPRFPCLIDTIGKLNSFMFIISDVKKISFA